MNKAKLFVISAPSGCGKGTLIAELNKRFDVYNSVSCTTRAPREGEIDGVHYHFISPEKYNEMVENDGFLEHAGFDSKAYGTPRKPVEDNLSNGRDVLLEIEPQGAFQVKEKMPDAVLVFILPPSVSEIERRLHKRSADSKETEEQIANRMKTVVPDIRRAYEYDYVMMNGELEKAIDDLTYIFTQAKKGGEGLHDYTAKSMKKTIDEVLENA